MKYYALSLVGALLLLLPTTSSAQEFHVSGSNVAGRASVARLGPTSLAGDTPVAVDVTWQVINQSRQVRVSGRGVARRGGLLEWSYRRGPAPDPRDAIVNGIVDHLLDRALGGRGGVSRGFDPNRVNVVMTPYGRGRYVGAVEGVPQVWTLATTTPTARSNATAANLVVLVVPGWSLGSYQGSIGYLDENVAAMRARGLQVWRTGLDPLQPVVNNARLIAQEVMKQARQGKRIILFAHGKGAADATAAVVLYPRIQQSVAGLVAVQPIYSGSPVADWFVSGRAPNSRSLQLIYQRVFQGRPAALLDTTTRARVAFTAQYPFPTQRIPTVVVRTTFNRSYGSRSLLWTSQALIQRYNRSPSDGIVTQAGQTLPGAFTIDIRDVDHFEAGQRGESRTTPAEITNQALTALINRLPRQPRSGSTVNLGGGVRINLPFGR